MEEAPHRTDPQSRLDRGETLMINDQWRSYIRMESGDGPERFVMRSVAATLEDAAIRLDLQSMTKYEEKRFGSLAEALLSLMDYEWRDPAMEKS